MGRRRGRPRRKPAEPDRDAVDVGVDGEGGPAHGEHEHAGGRLRAHAGQGGEVFLHRGVVEIAEPAQVDPALALPDLAQDPLDPACLLIRDAAAAYDVGERLRRRVEDLLPRGERGLETGERALRIAVRRVLRKHGRDQLVDDGQRRLGDEGPLAAAQQPLYGDDIPQFWHREDLNGAGLIPG